MSIPGIKDPNALRVILALKRKLDALQDEFSRLVRDGQIVLDHSALTNLDFNSSGHSGFASSTQLTSGLAGKVDKAGDSMTGDLTFGSDLGVELGDSAEGKIEWDSNGTYLVSGALAINGAKVNVRGGPVQVTGATIGQPALKVVEVSAGTTDMVQFQRSGSSALRAVVNDDGFFGNEDSATEPMTLQSKTDGAQPIFRLAQRAGATASGNHLDLVDSGGSTVFSVGNDGGPGFYSTAPTTKQTITGSRGGNAALADLLTSLEAYGLIEDSTTA